MVLNLAISPSQDLPRASFGDFPRWWLLSFPQWKTASYKPASSLPFASRFIYCGNDFILYLKPDSCQTFPYINVPSHFIKHQNYSPWLTKFKGFKGFWKVTCAINQTQKVARIYNLMVYTWVSGNKIAAQNKSGTALSETVQISYFREITLSLMEI